MTGKSAEGFLNFFGRIVDLILLNLFFLLTCLPIITIGTSLSALYHVILQMVDNTESYIFKTYLRIWRSSFKNSTLFWIPSLVIIFLLAFNIRSFSGYQVGSVKYIMICFQLITGIMLYAISQYYFPLTGCFENTVRITLKNSFILAMAYLPRTFACLCITALPPVLIFLVRPLAPIMLLIMIFFGCTGICFLKCLLLKPIFEKLKEQE